MWPAMLIAIYCVCLTVASLAGGWLPSLMRLTHTRMQLMMSFVGGLMLGVAILHLLPHAVVQTGSLDYAAWSCILGLLTMFLIIRVFNVHQHGPVPRRRRTTEVIGASPPSCTPRLQASGRAGRRPTTVASAGSGCSSAWRSIR